MNYRPTRGAHRAAGLLAAAIVILSSQLRAERLERPGLLLGGGAELAPSKVDVDPKLPRGAIVHSEPRPDPPRFVACSLREPVCVQHGDGMSQNLVQAYVTALEDAHSRLVGGMGLPAPRSDAGLGRTPGLDLYLSPDAPLDVRVVSDTGWRPSDQRSAHCRARPSRSELRRQSTLCVAEAVLLGVDAGEAPDLHRAVASYLCNSLEPASTLDIEAVDTLQSNPQLGLARRDAAPESAGGALLFHYVDRRLAAQGHGVLPVALLQLSRSQTAAGQLAWNNEPDAFDVLRRAFVESEESFDDFMLSFALERAFLGSRDNGSHNPELSWMGDAGRVRFDWVLKSSSLPRRVAPRRPLEPLGSAYLWLDLDRITLGKTLAFRANWEIPSVFRWTLVAVDARGSILKRYDLPYVQNATSAERTIEDLDGAVGLLIVGINLGGVDSSHPFDPDHEPFEPHGFTVYLTEL